MQGRRDGLLKQAGAERIGRGTIQARLYDLGPYPGAKASSTPGDRVKGEIHRLMEPGKAFEILDRYEGIQPGNRAEGEFTREMVSVTLENGSVRRAWAYLYNRAVEESRRVAGGDDRAIPRRSG